MARRGDDDDRAGREGEINEIKEIKGTREGTGREGVVLRERADTLLSMGLRQIHIARCIYCVLRGEVRSGVVKWCRRDGIPSPLTFPLMFPRDDS